MNFLAASEPNWNLLFGGLFVVLFLLIGAYSICIPQGGKRWWILSGFIAVLILLGVIVGEGLTRTLLVDTATFIAVGLVWDKNSKISKESAKKYLVLMVIAVSCILGGIFLGGGNAAAPTAPLEQIVVALFVIGFSLKLALVPFYFWLPAVAETASPMTTAIIVSIVDIAAFTELAHISTISPWVFAGYKTIWLIIAFLSMFGGAILALAQKNIKRMLAFSTIDDLGYLLLGVLAGTSMGVTGALIGAISHAIFKVLLFGSIGIVEKQIEEPVTLENHGLATQFPISSAAYIVGALGMIGMPPFIGFAGRWRLYETGVAMGGAALGIVMAAATALALFYYVRSIHRVWLGNGNFSKDIQEPKLASTVLEILIVFSIVLGLFPGILFAQI